ncbi:hypothetical protein [Bacillus paramycoides]|uniref:Group-specific protein n=1 Tax=Bacillus paramycoides TaxID=2026194 RepID=A0ABU6MRY1_9BACI|nr:hypothetical protein [Bacillus paramycoides]
MARCTYCKTKWKVKDVWSILVTFEKDCPYCFGRQYLSNYTFHHANAALPLLFLCPLLVDLSDENPLDKYRK